jgi:SAM-dependent methyltransferase
MTTETHDARDAAESFGADAERYDRTRPRYPDELVARIVAASPGPELLDVGIGTGIAARQFRAAGCRVVGVDVDDRMAAVLRPGGLLALFWNGAQVPPGLIAAFAAVHRPVMPGPLAEMWSRPVEEGYAAMASRAAEGIVATGAFGEPRRWSVEWDRTYSRDEWLDQLPTGGVYVRLTPARLDQVLAGVGAAIDAAGGLVPVHYTTVAVTAPRLG